MPAPGRAQIRQVSFAALRRVLTGCKRRQRTLLLGIDGLGGSGKSTFADELARWPDVTLVHVDDFYTGSGFDIQRLRQQVLDPLLCDRPGRYQRYDWSSGALAEWIDVPIGGIVAVEGVYATCAYLADAYDCRVWVECPADVRLARGLQRDSEEARDRWVYEWMPAEERYVNDEQPAARAELVVDGTRPVSPYGRWFTRLLS